MRTFFSRQLRHCLYASLAAITMVGCVDNDYDLTEDIDLTIQLGGDNLTLPGSNTDLLYLSKILDLNENSSIKAVEFDGEYGLAKGDYVLLQEGISSPSKFEVPEVTINELTGGTTQTDILEFINATGENTITQPTNQIINTIRLSENDVTRDLVSLSAADINAEILLAVRYTSSDFIGTAYIEEGYTVTFDKCWTLQINDPATAQIIETVNPYTLRIKKRCALRAGEQLTAKIHLTHIDFSDLPQGQGLYAPGKLLIENEISSSGDISVDTSDMPQGSRATLNVISTTSISSAQILKVRGIVDPKINITDTKFDINDIPDFLSDPDNNLDISNPQITISVTNNSPLSISLDGKLSAYIKGSETATVGIGEAYGTAPIIVRGNSTTNYCISREPISSEANNIVVPDLATLINTVPDRISFHDATSKAIQEEVEFTLGSTYTYNCDYNAIIPLAFGNAMNLNYTHIEDEWNEDLEKYNFKTAIVTADVVNTIPLDMVPSAIALDANGNEFTDINVTVDGNVSAGSIAQPSSSQLNITLSSNGKNIGGLDGVKLLFNASANSNFIGTNLNKEQAVKFDNIKITIKGGVLVDLN